MNSISSISVYNFNAPVLFSPNQQTSRYKSEIFLQEMIFKIIAVTTLPFSLYQTGVVFESAQKHELIRWLLHIGDQNSWMEECGNAMLRGMKKIFSLSQLIVPFTLSFSIARLIHASLRLVLNIQRVHRFRSFSAIAVTDSYFFSFSKLSTPLGDTLAEQLGRRIALTFQDHLRICKRVQVGDKAGAFPIRKLCESSYRVLQVYL